MFQTIALVATAHVQLSRPETGTDFDKLEMFQTGITPLVLTFSLTELSTRP